MAIFLATLTPMLTLFLCMAIGFALSKAKILTDTAGKTLAKLETWVFCPALNFMTMVSFCTVDSLSVHITNVFMACVSVTVAIGLATLLAPLFVKEKGTDRGVYKYALAFANSGYVGDPIVQSLFGDSLLAYYKLFCLPLSLLIYTWGISTMIPGDGKKGSAIKRLLNPPTISMLLGIAVGLSGTGAYLPGFVSATLGSLKACMGPVAMLLAGITVARFDFVSMLKNKKVYIATALRLVAIPALLITVLFLVKTLANSLFDFSISNDVLFLCMFATATPLGLNTVIFPEAYGGNPETGASMTMISHTLCVISIPLMYALMVAIFGMPFV